MNEFQQSFLRELKAALGIWEKGLMSDSELMPALRKIAELIKIDELGEEIELENHIRENIIKGQVRKEIPEHDCKLKEKGFCNACYPEV